MIIQYKGKTYTIPKELYEPDNIYLKRLWFVAKQEPDNKEKYEEAIHYSILWKNIKILNCKYNSTIHQKIDSIEKSFNIY